MHFFQQSSHYFRAIGNTLIFQPGIENFERSFGANLAQFDAILEAESIPDLFVRLEARELLLRIDNNVLPTAYRCAVVSKNELTQLRRVKDIVRLSHVRNLEPTQIVLDKGTVPAVADTLYIDCSANGIQQPPALPVFDKDRINLLTLRTCQPLYSAALIAYVESHITDQQQQNAMCVVVPNPEYPIDWLRMWAVSLANVAQWRQHAGLSAWQMQCRLNALAVYLRGIRPDDKDKMALVHAVGAKSVLVAAKLAAMLAQTPEDEGGI